MRFIDPNEVERQYRKQQEEAWAQAPKDLDPEDRQYMALQRELEDVIVLPLILWHIKCTNQSRDPQIVLQAFTEKMALMLSNFASNHTDFEYGTEEIVETVKVMLSLIVEESLRLVSLTPPSDERRGIFQRVTIESEEGGNA